MARKAAVRGGRNQRKPVKRCGHIMNCPARGEAYFKINGRWAYRCTSCSLTMSA